MTPSVPRHQALRHQPVSQRLKLTPEAQKKKVTEMNAVQADLSPLNTDGTSEIFGANPPPNNTSISVSISDFYRHCCAGYKEAIATGEQAY